MDDIIMTRDATKDYGRVRAVIDLSLAVRRGEIYGFLGLNGAGKSTTIRMLLGMVRPTRGAVYIEGKKVDPGKTGLWKDVGYIVETPAAYPDLTVRENLDIARRLRRIRERKAVDEVIERLSLSQYAERKAGTLSSGNAQRLGLARALFHAPAILILDEPANGLDPAGIVEIRGLLSSLAAEKGVTIFISSHILSEIARLATRIGIIHEGRLVREVDANSLDALLVRRLLVRARDLTGARAALHAAGFQTGMADEETIEVKDGRAITSPDEISRLLVRAGNPPTRLVVDEESLESFFLRTIGKQGGER